MARNYAALSHEYLEEMADLNDAEFGRLARALLKYSMTGEVVELPGNERFCFRRVRSHEDRHQASYAELSEKRSEAGRKGALSRWSAQADGRDGKAILPGAEDGKHGDTNTDTKTKYKTKTDPLLSSGRGSERMRRDLEALERAVGKERDGA